MLKGSNVAATFLYLTNKEYYDFEMNIDILFKSVGSAGIAFRYKDPFNYYAIKINRKQGYKEVIKVVNGIKFSLQKIEDGGILINSWHSIRIKTEADRFHIFIYDSEQITRANSEKVIEFQDSEISSGT